VDLAEKRDDSLTRKTLDDVEQIRVRDVYKQRGTQCLVEHFGRADDDQGE